MITLAIGLLLIVYGIRRLNELNQGKIIFIILSGIACCICALVIPIEGYNAPVLTNEVVLLPLKSEETQEIYYVEKNNSVFIYAYDNSQKYGLDGGAYEEDRVSGIIKIYESAECKVPILKVFSTSRKDSWFTLCPMYTTKEYIFYIPEGTTK